ncbi:molybdate ABC transporter substrate-binding protein [Sporosarcina koreensis]|uniref:molybdate ABC transporter substrate-binding protein n=1 Tax=Sporosarcina koreensis TaxID=334735 RepID=UPI00075443A3|nr:molybdate ABC transporter substrate-binding protein [Sporosarcina koreensis]
MKKLVSWLLLLMTMAISFGCSAEGNESAKKTELLISAAASLTDALDELKEVYESEHDDVTITLNMGSSGKLATQIEQGAPSDIFLSASQSDMERLSEKELVSGSSVVDFTKNSIVLIANKSTTDPLTTFEQLGDDAFEHLSIGQPETVPVGRYTKEVLEHLQLWTPLQNKLVMGSDVRQVLTHVELGNAEYGIVYSTDALVSDKVVVVAEADPAWHTPIVYPGAVVLDSKHPGTAQDFLDFVTGDEGKEILQKYGFK